MKSWSRQADRLAFTRKYQRPAAFTLVELLVVIAIIGILLALLIPAVQAARESSRKTQCANNLRQIGIGLHNYEAAHKRWPAGKKWSGPPDDVNSFAMAWCSFILKEIEQNTLYDAMNWKKPFTDPVNMPVSTQLISTYLCPSNSQEEEHRSDDRLYNLGGMPGEGLGCMDYMGISGPDRDAKNPISKEYYGRQRGVLIGTKGLVAEDELIEPPPVTSAKITDGLSHTLCVVECTGRGVQIENGQIDALHGAWASGVNVTHIDDGVNEPAPEAWQKERMHSDHTGGANVLLCDASVQFFSEDTPKKIIRWMASRDGGEQISEDLSE
jgi:prepilin-type N-terminal cleavage/methylation domain-containing protein/prepilin-type processing-associated H-X9-DG protein